MSKSLILSLDSWIAWLSRTQQDPRIGLRRAILAQDIPHHILHHFACDALEHSCSLLSTLGYVLPFSCQPMIDAKREWIEQRLLWSDFDQHSLVKLRQSLVFRYQEIPPMLAKKIHSLFRKEAHQAALDIIETLGWAGEIEWQNAHLIGMLQRYRGVLERLYGVLYHRKQQLHPHRDYWQQMFEMVLFAD